MLSGFFNLIPPTSRGRNKFLTFFCCKFLTFKLFTRWTSATTLKTVQKRKNPILSDGGVYDSRCNSISQGWCPSVNKTGSARENCAKHPIFPEDIPVFQDDPFKLSVLYIIIQDNFVLLRFNTLFIPRIRIGNQRLSRFPIST